MHAGLQMVGEKGIHKMTQVTSPKHWSPVLLVTPLQKDLHLSPQTGSSNRRWGESITMQRWLMMLGGCWMLLCCSSDSYAPATQRPSPLLGAKSDSGVVHCLRYTGEFNQPPMLGLVSWVWLGTHAGVTITNDREEPLLTFTTFIEHHHHIISSLHHYTYRLTYLGYTSWFTTLGLLHLCESNKNQLK